MVSFQQEVKQREPKPQLGHLAIGLGQQSCTFFRMGLDGYFLFCWDFKERVYYKREGKDSLLMHAFLPCFLPFFLISLFPFSLLLFFLILHVFPCLFVAPFSIYGYCSYLYWANPMRFLPCTPMAHQPFLFGCTTTTTLGHAQYLLSLPLAIQWQVQICLVLLGVLPLPTSSIRGPNHLLPILGKDAILAKHLPKEAYSWKLEIGHFPPPLNHTLCKSLDHRPTSLALARCRLVVLWS